MKKGKHMRGKGLFDLRYQAIGLLFLFLLGCAEVPDEPLRIASSPWPGYEPLYLARDLGYMDSKQVNLFELPSSDITMESFRNRSTDLATLTLDETLELLHDGTRLRILLVMDISHGGDAVVAKPDIRSLSDIKGKRISIVNIPLGLYMLNRLLDKAGVERDDVTVFPMSESKQVQFYKDGNADVVITFEPVKTHLINEGMHVIFDSSMIPNEIFDLLLVHEDVYMKRKDQVCAVVKSWFKALDYIEHNKADSAARITRRLGVDVGVFDELMSGIILPSEKENQELLGGDRPGILEPARRLANIMVQEQQLNHIVSVQGATDKDFAVCYTR